MKTKTVKTLPKIIEGTICPQLVRCGKYNCKCTRGELHGPYHYLFFRIKGKLIKRYIRSADVQRQLILLNHWHKQKREERDLINLSCRQVKELTQQLRSNENYIKDLREVSKHEE
jgi:hypothetical protein